MDTTVFFKTINNNRYLYDCNTSFSMLCHPSFENYINDKEDNYYKEKYNYLKKNGFFKERSDDNSLKQEDESIKHAIFLNFDTLKYQNQQQFKSDSTHNNKIDSAIQENNNNIIEKQKNGL